MKIVGERAFNPYIEGVAELQMNKVKDAFARAEIQYRSGAKAPTAARPASAPVAKKVSDRAWKCNPLRAYASSYAIAIDGGQAGYRCCPNCFTCTEANRQVWRRRRGSLARFFSCARSCSTSEIGCQNGCKCETARRAMSVAHENVFAAYKGACSVTAQSCGRATSSG